MNNGDKPINPLQNFGLSTQEQIMEYQILSGLTKREYFAVMAMQGLMSSTDGLCSGNTIAESSVMMADKLLKALEEIK